MNNPCAFSPCGTYRYTLHRRISAGPRAVMFLLLNPSTADDRQLDPTLRRCFGFSAKWGFDQMWVGNLFAYRSPSPQAMKLMDDPIGPDNDAHIISMARASEIVVCGWGVHGDYLGRNEIVMKSLRGVLPGGRFLCLGKTKHGHPRHPLYVRGDVELEGL